jgi:membrane glycosyltransferase
MTATWITGPLRRLLLFALVLTGTALALRLLLSVLATDGLSLPEVMILALFALTFAWISMAFWTAVAGFLLRLFGLQAMARAGELMQPGEGGVTGRIALLVPIYHEDPDAVGRRLAATWRSLQETGEGERFDAFLLSDSRDHDLVQDEQEDI